MSPENEPRPTGIEVIGAVPWGTHIAQFYQTRQDLLDVLVPYFKAGLENNEFCVWVTSKPLGEKEAREAMRKAVPDFAQYLERGQIETIPYSELYTKSGKLDADEVLQGWVEKEKQALKRGFDGLRLTGDTFWLERKDWQEFTDYEEEVDKAIGEYRMLAICSYSLDKCGVPEIMDVISNHGFTLSRQGENWVLVGNSNYRSAQEVLSLQGQIAANLAEGVVLTRVGDGTVVYASDRFEEMLGYDKGELIGKHVSVVNAPGERTPEETAEEIHGNLAKRGTWYGEVHNRKKGGACFWSRVAISAFEHPTYGKVWVSVLRDITESKRAEETLRESHEEYRQLFDSSPVGITTLNMKGVITSCNPAVYQEGGYTEGELIGKHFSKIAAIRVKDIPGFLRMFSSIVRGKIPEPFATAYQRKDGTTGWTELSTILLKAGGKKVGIQVVQRDITDLKRALKMTSPAASARKRPLTSLQERFVDSGLDGFNDREIVESLLSLALPYRECRKLAKECLAEFGDLSGFLAASPRELERVGITGSSMFAVRLLHELPLEVFRKKILQKSFYESSQEVFRYLRLSMRDLKKEVFKVLYLNNRSQIIDTVDLFEGTVENIHIQPREIVESALEHRATNLIFAHNHPAGDPAPSRTDERITRDLVFMGMITQLRVLDHIIIGGDTYYSFADEGLIKKYEDDFLNLKMRTMLNRQEVVYSRDS